MLLDGYRLVRRSGSWPGTQDLRLADTEYGTFSVRYTYNETPLLARMAATEIACYLARWIVQRIDALPTGVTGVVMDGVSLFVNPGGVDEAHTPWLAQLLQVYGGGDGVPVWSVELEERWRLHQVA
jgi:hypothetical protein